jgi:hypothetical protein
MAVNISGFTLLSNGYSLMTNTDSEACKNDCHSETYQSDHSTALSAQFATVHDMNTVTPSRDEYSLLCFYVRH